MTEVFVVQRKDRKAFLASVPDEVRATDPVMIGAVDTKSKSICGVLAATFKEDAWEISYIRVAEDFRRQGIAKRMLRLMMLTLSTLGIDTVYAQYLLHEEGTESLSVIDHILASEGFAVSENTNLYTVATAEALAHVSSKMKPDLPAVILPLSKVTSKAWNDFRSRLNTLGASYDTERAVPKDERALYMDPGLLAAYDGTTSCFYVDAEGRPSGCLLFVRNEDSVKLSYLCMLEDTVAAKKAMMGMFHAGLSAIVKEYGPDTPMVVNPTNRVSEQIFLKLTGGKEERLGTVTERSFLF